MTHDEFNAILEARIGKIRATLAGKAKEYATDDRLHNFKRAGMILKVSPEMALRGMWAKHLTSLLDMWETPWSDAWEEKLGDCINYLLLLEGIKRESVPLVPGPDLTDLPGQILLNEMLTRHAPASEKSLADACRFTLGAVRQRLQTNPDLYKQDAEGNWSLRK